MTSTWCTIATLPNYADRASELLPETPFSGGVVFGPLPDWCKSDDILDNLSLNCRERLRRYTTYAFTIAYEADALGTPDPEWGETGTRSIQSSMEERLNLANIAMWISCPCAAGIQLFLHCDTPGDGKRVRQANMQGLIVPHPQYADKKLTKDALVKAAKLHEVLLGLPRRGTLWTAVRTLWKALYERATDVHFLLDWIAVEALFGASDPREITYRLSHRMAFFLSADGSDAKSIFDMAKKGYSWRSRIVHGTSKINYDEFSEKWYEVEVLLLRRSLLRILSDAKLVSSFDSRGREEYLDSLAFGSSESEK